MPLLLPYFIVAFLTFPIITILSQHFHVPPSRIHTMAFLLFLTIPVVSVTFLIILLLRVFLWNHWNGYSYYVSPPVIPTTSWDLGDIHLSTLSELNRMLAIQDMWGLRWFQDFPRKVIPSILGNVTAFPKIDFPQDMFVCSWHIATITRVGHSRSFKIKPPPVTPRYQGAYEKSTKMLCLHRLFHAL